MKNQFTLEINKPCSENFSKFTPTKAGGFCGSCQEEVVDFTGMSSQEIINYFKENAGKSTCGRFTDYQLGSYTETQHKSKSYSFWKGLGLACLSLFTLNTVQAQETKPAVEVSEQNKTKATNIQDENIFVKGTVTDESGPLPGVSVLIEGTSIGTETDFDGNFEFDKPLKKGDVLIFSYLGMETKKVTISNRHSASKINMLSILMKESACVILGKVAVKEVYKSKKKF